MSIVKILAPVDGSKRDAVVLATAFAAAKPFNAHIKVLFSYPDPSETVPYTEMPLAPQIADDIINAAREIAAASSKSARASLATIAENMNVRIVGAPVKTGEVTASYEERSGHLVHYLEDAARFCELIVFPPIAGTDNPQTHEAFLRVLTKAQRPVLLCAEAAPAQLGSKIAIGWDGGFAAAHALSAALPYLSKAKAVKILAVQRTPDNSRSVEEVKRYLALHKVTSSECVINHGERNVAEFLLETAARSGCDMLVIGGYGHSRLRETIFGGVTQHIISHPTIPVFMVH